jgi:hypothetical protein
MELLVSAHSLWLSKEKVTLYLLHIDVFGYGLGILCLVYLLSELCYLCLSGDCSN